MICFRHTFFDTVYVSLHPHPVWPWTLPEIQPTRLRSIPLYCRQAPDQGQPERETGLVPVSFDHFSRFLVVISWQQAYRLDPALLEFVGRLVAYPQLPLVLEQVPRAASLRLVLRALREGEAFFAVYRIPEDEQHPLISLHPLLESLLPWQEIAGVHLFSVPCHGDVSLASEMFVLALERCLWGVHAPPILTYSLASRHDGWAA